MSKYILKSKHGNYAFDCPDLFEIALKVAQKTDPESIGFEVNEPEHLDIEIQDLKYNPENDTFSGVIYTTNDPTTELELLFTGEYNDTFEALDDLKFKDCGNNEISLSSQVVESIREKIQYSLNDDESFNSKWSDSEPDHYDYADSF